MLHLWTLRSPADLTAPAAKSRAWLWALVLLGSFGGASWTAAAIAQPTPPPVAPPTRPTQPTPAAPAELTTLLTQVDAAASSQNLPALMKFYGDNFTHTDGLTRQTLEQALTKLWQQYPKLTYRTELKAFAKVGSAYKVDTITYLTGTQQLKGRTLKIAATLQSQQLVEGQKIVRQEILAEQTTLTSGEKPPTLKILLPDQVGVGQDYNFDAIVQEPLENDLLLGTALAEPVNPETLLNPPKANLEPLLSGGLFKVGRAPNRPTQQWLSAVVVRQSGITIVTQRLRVVARAVGAR